MSEEFKFCKIDPFNCTTEELQQEIDRLTLEMNSYEDLQLALKIFLNSCYGAVGNKYFIAYNPDIAEAVTLQGQDIIKYSANIVDTYFQQMWHKDTELHSVLNVTNVKQIPDTTSCVVYVDTDSNYITFKPAMNSCNWHGDTIEFIMTIYETRLREYFNKCLEKYADKYGVKNIQKFELETISKNGIWLGKKKYVTNNIWKEPGIVYPDGTKITYKGVEIIQTSTPKFSREKLKYLVKYIFAEGEKLKATNIIGLMKKFKEEFKLENIENICMTRGISDYEKYVLNDRDSLILNTGCPIHVRAAAIYNHMLNHNKKYKKKYHIVHTNDKVKYYYVKDYPEERNIFGYLSGDYPIEFAPPFDYDMMFSKTMIDPINRFLEAIGNFTIPYNLIYSKTLW